MTDRVTIITGPTATGKSALAAALGEIEPVEIVNADSRQVIAGMTVGTAAPSAADIAARPHHLFGIRAPQETFTVADWLARAGTVIAAMPAATRAVVVGGTGLYITALLDGLDDIPAPDPALRIELAALSTSAAGRALLVAQLLHHDPEAARLVDLANPRRVIRALEIVRTTRRPLAEVWTRRQSGRRPLAAGTTMIGLDLDDAALRRRIEVRAEAMVVGGGLMAEVVAALDDGVPAGIVAACGIGYPEALAILAGELTVAEATAMIVRRTVRYARAQRTMLRRDPRIRWLDATQPVEALAAAVTP